MLEIVGVGIGALIVLISTALQHSFYERKIRQEKQAQFKEKQIQTLVLLNKKVNEILQKRNLLPEELLNFNHFDDCYISIDDFIYLQSFCAQNFAYLPNYIVEEFFKNIAHRRVVQSPEAVQEMMGYTYKGGRNVLESFSEDLLQCAEDYQKELDKLLRKKVSYFHLS